MNMCKQILNSILSFFGIKYRFLLDDTGKPIETTLPSISYAITVCNEAQQLSALLEALTPYLTSQDEIVIQADTTVTEEVKQVIKAHQAIITRYQEFALNRDFGAAKTHLNTLCRADYIFQLDADEMPSEPLLRNLKRILAVNKGIELFKIPRKNIVYDNANTLQETFEAWPDYQGRLYANVPNRIYWHRPLHERITGHRSYVYLPKAEAFALIHAKTYRNFQQRAQLYEDIKKRQA